MRSDELRDAGSLAGTALGEIAELAQGVHHAVAQRVFAFGGRRVEPVRLLHDGIAAVAYSSTRFGVRYLPPAASAVAAMVRDPAAESAHDVQRGRFVLGAMSGFWGDRMAQSQPALAPLMRMRLHGGRLRRLPANLAADAADAGSVTGRLVVFVHGLCETDLCWSFAAEKRWGDRTCTYGSRLRDDDGWTPLYLNFNTGVHVSENGRELAEMLEELVRCWPAPVLEIALVGHSLGGLVARSAAHQGDKAGHEWIGPLRHIVALGAPHLGAPLERFTNWGTHHLGRLPETRPFAGWLNRRSVGIKDLRFGSCLDEDWSDCDPDEFLRDRCRETPFLPHAAYYFVGATLTAGPLGAMLGDLLVRMPSASGRGSGRGRSIPFEVGNGHELAGLNHFDLLNHPAVYEQLRIWLTRAATRRALPAATA